MARPYVILNTAMSLDGKIAKKGERIRFSNDLDKKRVHNLRAGVDAIMVGINTILVDDPKLTSHHADAINTAKNPTRIIVDSKVKIPLDAKALDNSAEKIVAVSKNVISSRVDNIKKKTGAEVIVTGGEDEVDLTDLMGKLKTKYKIKTVLLEGGGTLNRNMLLLGLVDEIYVTVSSMLLGGKKGVDFINGTLQKEINLNLEGIMQLDDQVVLHYKIQEKRGIGQHYAIGI